MIVANDATVKAGAFFPQTVKKLIRAQRIAFENNLPLIYLVDSAGVFLRCKMKFFRMRTTSGASFENNSVISAAGVPQFAAIMGNCVAAAPICGLVRQDFDDEGADYIWPAFAGQSCHRANRGSGRARRREDASEISGTVDFYEKNDEACLEKLRSLVALLPEANEKYAMPGGRMPRNQVMPFTI